MLRDLRRQYPRLRRRAQRVPAIAFQPAQLPAEQGVDPEDLGLRFERAPVKGIFRVVEQKRVRLRRPVRNEIGEGENGGLGFLGGGGGLPFCGSGSGGEFHQQTVVVVEAAGKDGAAAADRIGERGDPAGQRIVEGRAESAFDGYRHVGIRGDVLVVGVSALREEQPAVVPVLAVLGDQAIRERTRGVAELDLADRFQSREQIESLEGKDLGRFPQFLSAVGGDGVFVERGFAEEEQAAAVLSEGFEPFKGGRAQGLAARDDHDVVAHFPDGERGVGRGAERGQKRFGDEIEVHRAEEQPFGDRREALFELVADRRRLFGGSPVEPVALDGVDHADPDDRFSAGEGGRDAREMVFDVPVFGVPGGLIVDRRGVVALGFALHRDPGEVRDADGHAERRLPVPVQLVAAEIVIPAGHAVQLA